MGKLLLVVLVLLGAGLYFPESREVMVETARPALNPWHRWTTSQQLARIVDDLETLTASRGELPLRQDEFEAWLDDRYQAVSSRVDGWGTSYRLEARGAGFRVLSAGPDGQFGTEDDLEREGTRAGR